MLNELQTRLFKETVKFIIDTPLQNMNSPEFAERLSWLTALLPELTNEDSDVQKRNDLFTAFLEMNPLRMLQKLSACRIVQRESFGTIRVFLVYSDFIEQILNLAEQRNEMETYLMENQGIKICLKELELLQQVWCCEDSVPLLIKMEIAPLLSILFNVVRDEKSCLQIRKENPGQPRQVMALILGKS